MTLTQMLRGSSDSVVEKKSLCGCSRDRAESTKLRYVPHGKLAGLVMFYSHECDLLFNSFSSAVVAELHSERCGQVSPFHHTREVLALLFISVGSKTILDENIILAHN